MRINLTRFFRVTGLILVYVAIMAAKLARIDRELGELADVADGRARSEGESRG